MKEQSKDNLCELTIKLDTCFHNELESYLNSLNGILETKVDINDSTIYVKYNNSIINYSWIKLEISFFLKCNYLLISEFDKHSKVETSKYEFIVNNLCCEHCLKSNIEYLLSFDGIEKVYSNYNGDVLENVKIFIHYNNDLISEQDLKNIYNIFINKVYVFENNLDWNLQTETVTHSSKKDNIINEEFICFNLNSINERKSHINIYIRTNFPVKKIKNLEFNKKTNLNNFVTDFLVSFENRNIPNNINYDTENIILVKKDNNLYTLILNFKIINLILQKDFKLI